MGCHLRIGANLPFAGMDCPHDDVGSFARNESKFPTVFNISIHIN